MVTEVSSVPLVGVEMEKLYASSYVTSIVSCYCVARVTGMQFVDAAIGQQQCCCEGDWRTDAPAAMAK